MCCCSWVSVCEFQFVKCISFNGQIDLTEITGSERVGETLDRSKTQRNLTFSTPGVTLIELHFF